MKQTGEIEGFMSIMNNAHSIEFSSPTKYLFGKMLDYELRQLRRESEHLIKKSKERELSDWEKERYKIIYSEITSLKIEAASRHLTGMLAA